MANRTRRPLEERFWAKVNKNGPVPAHRPDLGPCWLWTGSLKNGYGCIGSGGKRGPVLYAHRLSYEMHIRPLPSGRSMHVDHLCRVLTCVNPDHLELVTCGENVHRGYDVLTEVERRKTGDYCPQDHEYTPENTYRPPGEPTHRMCRACARDRYHRNKKLKAGREVSRAPSPPLALAPTGTG